MFWWLRGQAAVLEVPSEKRKSRAFVFEPEIELLICPRGNLQEACENTRTRFSNRWSVGRICPQTHFVWEAWWFFKNISHYVKKQEIKKKERKKDLGTLSHHSCEALVAGQEAVSAPWDRAGTSPCPQASCSFLVPLESCDLWSVTRTMKEQLSKCLLPLCSTPFPIWLLVGITFSFIWQILMCLTASQQAPSELSEG